MGSLVYFEILRSGKDLAAGGEGAGEGLLPGVHPQVVHQLVLGLEWPARPGTGVPAAGVVGYLRPSHMLHGQVGHDLVHRAEELVAGLAGRRLLRIDPEAGDLLFHRLAHVPATGSNSSVASITSYYINALTERKEREQFDKIRQNSLLQKPANIIKA